MGDVTDRYTKAIPKGLSKCSKLSSLVDELLKTEKSPKELVDAQLTDWESSKVELSEIAKEREDVERWGRYKRTHRNYSDHNRKAGFHRSPSKKD
jgi:hypothetical protein